MHEKQQLLAITPIDGRYAHKLQALNDICSEYGLIRRRLFTEIAWFKKLNGGLLPDKPAFDEVAIQALDFVEKDFGPDQALEIKAIEKTTNHDVKAVELWLMKRLENTPGINERLSMLHFGITSEDINNIAYAMQIRDIRDRILLPTAHELLTVIKSRADDYAHVGMLARTHGQPATPTTLGKELNVFAERLHNALIRLESIAIKAKWNGATGNFNALVVAYPDIDWLSVGHDFVESLGFTYNPVTTQIESHDWLASFSYKTMLMNTILTDLTRDMWMYISLGYFAQQANPDEVGSSTMPHKINPIDFENAEANFGIANAVFGHLSAKLPISRLQRDLSDSSALRSLNEAFAHTYLALLSLDKGMHSVHADTEKIAHELQSEWSILAEAVQTVMRRYGNKDAYDIIKKYTRGRPLNHVGYQELVESIDLPDEAKEHLRKLTPEGYVGLAPVLATFKKQK